MTFREEYPRLAELGIGFLRLLGGCVAAAAVAVVCREMGATEFAAGYMAGITLMLVWRD